MKFLAPLALMLLLACQQRIQQDDENRRILWLSYQEAQTMRSIMMQGLEHSVATAQLKEQLPQAYARITDLYHQGFIPDEEEINELNPANQSGRLGLVFKKEALAID